MARTKQAAPTPPPRRRTAKQRAWDNFRRQHTAHLKRSLRVTPQGTRDLTSEEIRTIRTHVSRDWKGLSTEEKKKFARDSYVHDYGRHPIPPKHSVATDRDGEYVWGGESPRIERVVTADDAVDARHQQARADGTVVDLTVDSPSSSSSRSRSPSPSRPTASAHGPGRPSITYVPPPQPDRWDGLTSHPSVVSNARPPPNKRPKRRRLPPSRAETEAYYKHLINEPHPGVMQQRYDEDVEFYRRQFKEKLDSEPFDGEAAYRSLQKSQQETERKRKEAAHVLSRRKAMRDTQRSKRRRNSTPSSSHPAASNGNGSRSGSSPRRRSSGRRSPSWDPRADARPPSQW